MVPSFHPATDGCIRHQITETEGEALSDDVLAAYGAHRTRLRVSFGEIASAGRHSNTLAFRIR